MRFYISPTILKQQVKLTVKHWPFSPIQSTSARELLCRLYGYQSNHQYQTDIKCRSTELKPITKDVVVNEYSKWVKKLADLASINQIQAKQLLHKLWPAYLSEPHPLSDKLYRSQFKFYGVCNDFLNASRKNQWIEYEFDDRPSVKDTIEALGVPHPEVGAIQVRQIVDSEEEPAAWVGFDYLLMDKDVVEVYPNPHLSKLLPYKPQGKLTFLLDVHLGSLARYMRMAGFDCLHESYDYGDEMLAQLSHSNNYVLLTRDIGLLKRTNVKYGRWIRNTETSEQFKEVFTHYGLAEIFNPFSRCVKCNGEISTIPKENVREHVPEDIFEKHQEFQHCKSCQQIYWKGSHYEKINEILKSLV